MPTPFDIAHRPRREAPFKHLKKFILLLLLIFGWHAYMFARSFERSMKIACERRRTALLMHPVVEDPLNTSGTSLIGLETIGGITEPHFSVGICTIPGTGLTHPTPVLVGSLRASGATVSSTLLPPPPSILTTTAPRGYAATGPAATLRQALVLLSPRLCIACVAVLQTAVLRSGLTDYLSLQYAKARG